MFWMSGVVVPHVWELTRDALSASGADCTPGLCFDLMDREAALTTGAMTPDNFCSQAVALAGVTLSPARLASRIQQGIAPLPGISGLIGTLTARYPLQLLSDFPREWLAPALARTGLAASFADDSIVMIADLDVDDTHEALLKALVDAGLFTPGRSLLVADDPILTEAAIRAGLDAILFVDTPRFKRELSLIDLLPSPSIT
jgi:FMN phosphatase YigB (HAD superfamily)